MLSVSLRFYESQWSAPDSDCEEGHFEAELEPLHNVELCTLQPPLTEEGVTAQHNVMEVPHRLLQVGTIGRRGNRRKKMVPCEFPSNALRWSELSHPSLRSKGELRDEQLHSLHAWREMEEYHNKQVPLFSACEASDKNGCLAPPSAHIDPAFQKSLAIAQKMSPVAPFLCFYDLAKDSGLSIELRQCIVVTAMTALRWVLREVLLYSSVVRASSDRGEEDRENESASTFSSFSLQEVAAGISRFLQSSKKYNAGSSSLSLSPPPCGEHASSRYCNEVKEDLKMEVTTENSHSAYFFMSEGNACGTCPSLFYKWCLQKAYGILCDCQVRCCFNPSTARSCKVGDYFTESTLFTSSDPVSAEVVHRKKTAELFKEKNSVPVVEVTRVRWTTSLVRALTDIYSYLCSCTFHGHSCTAVSLFAVIDSCRKMDFSAKKDPSTLFLSERNLRNASGEDTKEYRCPYDISHLPSSFTFCGALLRLEITTAFSLTEMRPSPCVASTLPNFFFVRSPYWRRHVSSLVEVLLNRFVRPSERARDDGYDVFQEAMTAQKKGRWKEAVILLQEAKKYFEECLSLAQEGLQWPLRCPTILGSTPAERLPSFPREENSEEEEEDSVNPQGNDTENSSGERRCLAQHVLETSRERAALRQRLDIATEILWDVYFFPLVDRNVCQEGRLNSSLVCSSATGVAVRDTIERFWQKVDVPFVISGAASPSIWSTFLHTSLEGEEQKKIKSDCCLLEEQEKKLRPKAVIGDEVGSLPASPSSFAAVQHDRVQHHQAVQPAVAAMAWRETFFSSSSSSRIGKEEVQNTTGAAAREKDGLITAPCPTTSTGNTTTFPRVHKKDGMSALHEEYHTPAALLWSALLPSPTALQWLLYTLFRLLVVGVANTAQGVLLLHRLSSTSQGTLSDSTAFPSGEQISHWASASAEACEKAVGLVRNHLLAAHRPCASDLYSLLHCVKLALSNFHEKEASKKTERKEGGDPEPVNNEESDKQAPLLHLRESSSQELVPSTDGWCEWLDSLPLPPAFLNGESIINNASSTRTTPLPSASSSSSAELLWCFQMHVKLLLRAHQLWRIAEDREREKAVKTALHDVYASRWSKVRAAFEKDESCRKENVGGTHCSEVNEKNNVCHKGLLEPSCSSLNLPFADWLVGRLSVSDWEDLDKNRCAYLP